MSTFRVKNNYSDGYVDENGFVRKNIHEALDELKKKIDMIDPNGDNNEFIINLENQINEINSQIQSLLTSINQFQTHISTSDTKFQDLFRTTNEINDTLSIPDRVYFLKSDWIDAHSMYNQYEHYNWHNTTGSGSYVVTELYPGDYNTLSEYLSAFSAQTYKYISDIYDRVAILYNEVLNTEKNPEITKTTWTEYLNNKPDEKYLGI